MLKFKIYATFQSRLTTTTIEDSIEDYTSIADQLEGCPPSLSAPRRRASFVSRPLPEEPE